MVHLMQLRRVSQASSTVLRMPSSRDHGQVSPGKAAPVPDIKLSMRSGLFVPMSMSQAMVVSNGIARFGAFLPCFHPSTHMWRIPHFPLRTSGPDFQLLTPLEQFVNRSQYNFDSDDVLGLEPSSLNVPDLNNGIA
jgi:hypothetical protein